MKSMLVLIPTLLSAACGVFPPAARAAEGADEPSLLTTIKEKVGPKGPDRVFKLYSVPARSNYWYRVDVCDPAGKVLQSEKIRNGVTLEDVRDAFRVVDVDGDGFRDIKVLGGTKDGKPWYKIWLYDPAKQKFVWSTRSE